MIVVVMGVSGVGKTTIGSELARRMKCAFADADDYHSAANKQKMHAGIPLTDEDRLPWLQSLNRLLRGFAARGQNVVLACSALKDSYRSLLQDGLTITWVYLKASPEVIRERLRQRHGHFAGEALLRSQFSTLEEPGNATIVDADRPVEAVVQDILKRILPLEQTPKQAN
jgi:gluconokinase